MKSDANYEQFKRRRAEVSREWSVAGREIGPPSEPVDSDRKNICFDNLALFCKTYLGNRFPLEWSPDHLKCIAKLQSATVEGGQFAFAMPRGSGKTSLCSAAALWAVLYGHRSFVVMIGATEGAAVELLDSVKAEIETNPVLGEDFDEVCRYVRALEGIHNRVGGQTAAGERTRIEWTDRAIQMPTVTGSVSSGAVIRTTGISGRIRGMSHVTAEGRTIRPDLVIIDDPQDDESANSPTQNAKREAILSKAVLGLAGPKVKISAVMPCTVIAPKDMADRVLDRESHPEWNGERTRLVYQFPSNSELWERYDEIRVSSLREGRGIADATKFYRSNRAAMDAGAKVAWDERFNPDELSAIQHAMNLKFQNPKAFRAEYQNDPDPGDLGVGAKELIAGEIAKRTNGVDRFAVPRECSLLTAGFDAGGGVHWYVVIGWTEGFGGSVIDYGCFPRQSRGFFAANDARPKLKDVFKGHTDSQVVYAGLRALTDEVIGKAYHHEQTGGEMKIGRALVDCGYESNAVYQFARASPFVGLLTPSKGIGRTTTARGVSEWKPRPGERSGPFWRLTKAETGRGQMVQFDPDYWKSIVYERITAPLGGRTALTMFGKSAVSHEMFSEHLSAEYASPVTLRGATFDKWQVRPDRTDNHWLDCLVLAAVAASVSGLVLSATADGVPFVTSPRQRVSLAELQKQRRAEKIIPQAVGPRRR